MYNELIKKVCEAETPFQPMGGDELSSLEAKDKAERVAKQLEIDKKVASLGAKLKADKYKMMYLLREILIERDVESASNDDTYEALYYIYKSGMVGWDNIDDAEVMSNIEELYDDEAENIGDEETPMPTDIPVEDKAIWLIAREKPRGWDQ